MKNFHRYVIQNNYQLYVQSNDFFIYQTDIEYITTEF